MSAGRKNTSEKKDWNTPPKYVSTVEEFFGGIIDLDPCSNEHSLIKASQKFILPVDGLKIHWGYEHIYINPPYGRDSNRGTTIYDWIEKAYESHKKYKCEILCLIPVATNTKHFKEIIFKNFTGICFLEDTRLKFFNGGHEDKKGAPMACCMVYIGFSYQRFQNVFKKFGKCFYINPDDYVS